MKLNSNDIHLNKPRDFRLFLQEELERRCKRNPRYSLRAFAHALQMHHGTMSQILRGTRPLSLKAMIKMGKLLGLNPEEMNSFFISRQFENPDANTKSLQFQQLSMDTFYAISEYYHDAILELTHLSCFRPDMKWIAKVLGITIHQVRIAVERLQRLELLTVDNSGAWIDQSAFNTIVETDLTSSAQRNLQKQLLEKATEAIEKVNKSMRDNSSITMAIDSADLPAAKDMIKQFRRMLCSHLQRKDTKPNQVYQLAIAFFPLTELKENP